jgi:Zn-dependent metalloprotease
MDFFTQHADLFGIDDPRSELALVTVERDRLGYTSVRFEQRAKGIRVLGGDIRAQLDPAGLLHTVNGRLIPQPRPAALAPRIAADVAMAIARRELGIPSRLAQAPELVVAPRDDADRLAYDLVLATDEPARWHVLVDALTGTVIERRDILRQARDRRIYAAETRWDLPGTLIRSEGGGTSADETVNTVYNHAGRVYDYFRNTFGRDSLDDAGMPMMASIVREANYANAFWNGDYAVFGNGDGQRVGPLGRGLDVVAHEFTHGITERTARFVYSDEPGALDEAYADIFAALIDGDDWEIGEDVATPAVPGDALRSLADPKRYGQPSTYAEYKTIPEDNGGVHYNSAIFAHAAYLIGLRIGRPKLAQISYRTLTTKLTSSAEFADAAALSIQACEELVGISGIVARDCRLVQQSFADVGLAEPVPGGEMRFAIHLPLVAGR